MKNYCTECGSILLTHKIKKFDGLTGEQLEAKHCTNLKCEEGCSFATGHKSMGFFIQECKDCGYVQRDY